VRPNIRSFTTVSLLLVLVGLASAQDRSVSFMRLGTDIIQKKLATQPATPEQRAPALRALFNAAGCRGRIIEQPVEDAQSNLICSTPGTGNSIIIVSAPLDYSAKPGDEEQLRWGDLSMLPLLAESLSAVVTRHSIVFIAYSGKNNGQAGAKAYVERLSPEQRAKIDGVIALDEIGRTPPAYSVPGTGNGMDIHTGGNGRMSTFVAFNPNALAITRPLVRAAQRWNYDVPSKTSDSGAPILKPFYQAQLNAISFTSPAWTVLRYVGDHPIRDYRTKLDLQSYEQTYLFLSAYLLFLDRDMSKPEVVPIHNAAEVIRDTRLEALQKTVESRKTEIATALPPPEAEPTPAPAPSVAVAVTPAATAPPPDATTPVFRTTARLVQVDVVALDKQGHPLTDLKREDFTVLQDGRPQSARVFEAHHTPLPERTAEPAEKAQDVQPHYLNSYSNAPSAAANQNWTIILFDMLNTPTQDQQVARNQLRKIAAALPEHQPVALFLLGSKLVMVQAFTTDGHAIQTAVNTLTLQRSQMLTTEAERQHEVGTANYIAETMSPSIPAAGNVPQSIISDFQAQMTSNSLQGLKNMESMRLSERVIFTLDAFAGLSRSLAGYPGRKNVVWLSGNFPIRVEPDISESDKWRLSTDYNNILSRTMALLSESRVAVYPVDIRGMQLRGVDITTSTTETSAFIGGNGGTNPGSSVDRTGSLLTEQSSTGFNERATMEEVAAQTGGRAFLNTNDFSGAIARAMDDGSNYYTLAYAPDTKDDKPSFHRIDVKLNRPDVKLSYRRGYYSLPESATPQTGLAALQGALQAGMPPSTMLFFTASAKPDSIRKSVEISYVVNGSNVTLTDVANGGKHVLIDCMAIAFDKNGKEVAHASDTLDGTLPAAAAEATLNRGLPATQELQLKPGVYNLRVGVQDRASQRIGTVTIPVVVQ